MLSIPIHKPRLSVVESQIPRIFLPCLSPSIWIAVMEGQIQIDRPSPRQDNKVYKRRAISFGRQKEKFATFPYYSHLPLAIRRWKNIEL